MADFAPALQRILAAEGGYSDDPADRGGKTMYGITEAKAREHGYTGEMRDLPLETACAIYRKDYWDRIKGDLITDQQIAEKLCDMAVNFGTATAVMILQDVLNALNDRATLWGDLPVTGNFGPMTLEALSHALSQHPQHRRSILFGLAACAGARYIAICKRDPEQERFARGWLLRAELL